MALQLFTLWGVVGTAKAEDHDSNITLSVGYVLVARWNPAQPPVDVPTVIGDLRPVPVAILSGLQLRINSLLSAVREPAAS